MKSISAAIVVLAGALVYASGVAGTNGFAVGGDARGTGLLVGFVGGLVWIVTLFQPSKDRDAQ